MCSDGTMSDFGLEKHSNEVALSDLAYENWLSCFQFPTIQANGFPTKSAGVTKADRLDLTRTYPSDALDQLAQDLSYLCQVALAAYEHSEYLLTIVRPFLSRAARTEVIAVAQCGECTMPAETRGASILWLAIANLTEIANGDPLDEVVAGLNAHLETMAQVVYRYHLPRDSMPECGRSALLRGGRDRTKGGCDGGTQSDHSNPDVDCLYRWPGHCNDAAGSTIPRSLLGSGAGTDF